MALVYGRALCVSVCEGWLLFVFDFLESAQSEFADLKAVDW